MRDQGIIPDSIKEGHLMACAKAFVIVEEKKEELAKLTKKAEYKSVLLDTKTYRCFHEN
jgi:hypothetical protein